MFTFGAMQIFIFLIPGFIAETILNLLVVRKDKSDLGKVIEALIFSLIIYVAFSLLVSKSPIALTVVSEAKEGASSTYTLYNNGIQFLWLLLFSILLPLILGYLITNDFHMILLRKLHITGKTSRESVWLDLFLNCKRWVIVSFEDGSRITGFPQRYSDDPSSQYIYLYKPAWLVYNEKKKEDDIIEIADIDGILITPLQKINSIMFISDTSE